MLPAINQASLCQMLRQPTPTIYDATLKNSESNIFPEGVPAAYVVGALLDAINAVYADADSDSATFESLKTATNTSLIVDEFKILPAAFRALEAEKMLTDSLPLKNALTMRWKNIVKHLNTALTAACCPDPNTPQPNNLPHIEHLLYLGAAPKHIKLSSAGNSTLLHQAAIKNSPEIAALLCASAAEVDSTDDFDYTPLHYAAKKSPEMVAFLLNKDASLASTNNHGQTPLSIAISQNNQKTLDIILNHVAMNDDAEKNKLWALLDHAFTAAHNKAALKQSLQGFARTLQKDGYWPTDANLAKKIQTHLPEA